MATPKTLIRSKVGARLERSEQLSAQNSVLRESDRDDPPNHCRAEAF